MEEGRLANLGCATGHLSFVVSNSFTNQTLAIIKLWTNSEEYEKKVYILLKYLDEKLEELNLSRLDVEVETLNEEQVDYIGLLFRDLLNLNITDIK